MKTSPFQEAQPPCHVISLSSHLSAYENKSSPQDQGLAYILEDRTATERRQWRISLVVMLPHPTLYCKNTIRSWAEHQDFRHSSCHRVRWQELWRKHLSLHKICESYEPLLDMSNKITSNSMQNLMTIIIYSIFPYKTFWVDLLHLRQSFKQIMLMLLLSLVL